MKKTKNFQEAGIYNLGAKELEALDANDLKAVKAFKKEWDLRRWPYEKVYKYFRKIPTGIQIDKLMANVIWQRYLLIS